MKYKLLNLNYFSWRGDTVVPLSTGVLFQNLYLNVQGISIVYQVRDDNGSHRSIKDMIQDIGRIFPCTG